MSERSNLRVVAAVIRRGTEFLITRRFDDAHLGGLWEFPGGKVEVGEDLPSALEREIGEEIGIDIEVGPKLLEDSHAYADRTIQIHFFECRVVAGVPDAIGVAEWRWVSLADLVDFDFPRANCRLLDRLRALYG